MNVVLALTVIFAILCFLAMIGEEDRQSKELYTMTFRILVVAITIMVLFKTYG